jgi:hypothetical protein
VLKSARVPNVPSPTPGSTDTALSDGCGSSGVSSLIRL